jgi:hypothetical protein
MRNTKKKISVRTSVSTFLECIKNFKLRSTYISDLIPCIISTNKDSLTTVLHDRHNTFQPFAHIIPLNFIQSFMFTISHGIHFRIHQSTGSWLRFSKGNINYNSCRCHVALLSTNVACLMHIRYYSTFKDPTLQVSAAAPNQSRSRRVCIIDSLELRSTKRYLVTSSRYKIQRTLHSQ